MSGPKKPARFVLTPEQRKIVGEIRRLAEAEKLEMLAEGRRVFAAEESVSARLQAAMSILKAVRKSHGVTLDEVSARTGMTKPYLSKLENDDAANVTINTLYRIADALEHDLQISVNPPRAVATESEDKGESRRQIIPPNVEEEEFEFVVLNTDRVVISRQSRRPMVFGVIEAGRSLCCIFDVDGDFCVPVTAYDTG